MPIELKAGLVVVPVWYSRHSLYYCLVIYQVNDLSLYFVATYLGKSIFFESGV